MKITYNNFTETLYDKLVDALYNMVQQEFEDNIAIKLASRVKDYNPNWIREDESETLQMARERYVEALLEDLLYYVD